MFAPGQHVRNASGHIGEVTDTHGECVRVVLKEGPLEGRVATLHRDTLTIPAHNRGEFVRLRSGDVAYILGVTGSGKYMVDSVDGPNKGRGFLVEPYNVVEPVFPVWVDL